MIFCAVNGTSTKLTLIRPPLVVAIIQGKKKVFLCLIRFACQPVFYVLLILHSVRNTGTYFPCVTFSTYNLYIPFFALLESVPCMNI